MIDGRPGRVGGEGGDLADRAGDHTLVLGRVEAADTYANAPLTYWQRAFGTHKTF